MYNTLLDTRVREKLCNTSLSLSLSSPSFSRYFVLQAGKQLAQGFLRKARFFRALGLSDAARRARNIFYLRPTRYGGPSGRMHDRPIPPFNLRPLFSGEFSSPFISVIHTRRRREKYLFSRVSRFSTTSRRRSLRVEGGDEKAAQGMIDDFFFLSFLRARMRVAL